MADEQQHKDKNSSMQQEPPESLTGLNLISDTSTNEHTSKKSTALAEVDPNSVSNVNSNASANTKSKSDTDPKKVTIAEPSEEASSIDVNPEVALPESEDHGDGLDDGIGGAGIPMEVDQKKKKNKKKKPKSQRGLVRIGSIIEGNHC